MCNVINPSTGLYQMIFAFHACSLIVIISFDSRNLKHDEIA